MFSTFQVRHFASLSLFLCTMTVRAQTDRAHELASQASSQVTADCQNVTTLADCHPAKPTGCSNAASPRYDAYLNFLKNQQPGRDTPPNRVLNITDLISLEDKIPTSISRSNHAQFADQLADLGNSLGEGNIYAVGSRGVLNTRLHGASYATRFAPRPYTSSKRFPVYGNVTLRWMPCHENVTHPVAEWLSPQNQVKRMVAFGVAGRRF